VEQGPADAFFIQPRGREVKTGAGERKSPWINSW